MAGATQVMHPIACLKHGSFRDHCETVGTPQRTTPRPFASASPDALALPAATPVATRSDDSCAESTVGPAVSSSAGVEPGLGRRRQAARCRSSRQPGPRSERGYAAPSGRPEQQCSSSDARERTRRPQRKRQLRQHCDVSGSDDGRPGRKESFTKPCGLIAASQALLTKLADRK